MQNVDWAGGNALQSLDNFIGALRDLALKAQTQGELHLRLSFQNDLMARFAASW